jgi:hypothetical protein
MKTRSASIRLRQGDVTDLLVRRIRRTVHLVVFDHGATEPLIQAQLSRAECRSLTRALAPRRGRWRR